MSEIAIEEVVRCRMLYRSFYCKGICLLHVRARVVDLVVAQVVPVRIRFGEVVVQ